MIRLLCPARFWAVLVFFMMVGLLTGGCGSGGGDNSSPSPQPTPVPQSPGSALITVQWPSRTGRLIPIASESVVVVLEDAAHKELARSTAVRVNEDASTTQVRFTGVPVGDYFVAATAYPSADGTGVAQAQATVPLSILSGAEASLLLSLQSTITSITVEPAALAPVPVGQTTTLSAVARNASGVVVLISGQQLGWQTFDPTIATVNANGVVTGQAAGQTTITVQDTESGSAAQVQVFVAGPL